jgi:uncharacterized protein (TIGR03067 family)
MMRNMILSLIACGCFLGADDAKEGTTDDQKQIQGTWQLVSGERHGKVFDPEMVKQVTLIFSDNKLTTKKKGQSTEAKFRLHPETNPTGIDIDMEGELGLGIYVLTGDDLTILHGEVGDPRPEKLEVKGLARPTLLVLKRAKVQ